MAVEPTIVRKKRKRTKYPLHWAITPLVVLVASTWGWRHMSPSPPKGEFVVPGYITSTVIFEQENGHFYGPAVKNGDAEEKFQLAADLMSKRDYGGASALLEEAGKQAALPIIFNDLGVLYTRMDNPARAVYDFREALARDAGYGPAQQNLKQLSRRDLRVALGPR
jgi:hypothetical protein